MSLGINPIDHPDLYDSIILAGRVSPGRARVSMPMRTEGWEKQKAKGADGAETVNNGADLIEFDVELYLWRDERVDHFEAWENWSPVLLTPVKAGNPMALDIFHPQLDGLGISSVVVKQRSNPQPDGKGGATVKLKFLQYSPPKKKPGNGKPKGSKSGGTSGGGADGGGDGKGGANDKGKPKKPDPNQDLKNELDDLTDEFKRV